jgi:hypothetical protein
MHYYQFILTSDAKRKVLQKDLQELQVTREDEARKGKGEIKVSLILALQYIRISYHIEYNLL